VWAGVQGCAHPLHWAEIERKEGERREREKEGERKRVILPNLNVFLTV